MSYEKTPFFVKHAHRLASFIALRLWGFGNHQSSKIFCLILWLGKLRSIFHFTRRTASIVLLQQAEKVFTELMILIATVSLIIWNMLIVEFQWLLNMMAGLKSSGMTWNGSCAYERLSDTLIKMLCVLRYTHYTPNRTGV